MMAGAAQGLVGSLPRGVDILDMFERDRPVIGIGEMALHLGLHTRPPVFDPTGTVGVSGPDSRADEAGIQATAGVVRRAARTISARLGAPREIAGWGG
jgi:DNA-binding IclR family transcriptional regulator